MGGRIDIKPDNIAQLVDEQRWCRLSEQFFRVDKWSVCRG
jgi:hypothetical protein